MQNSIKWQALKKRINTAEKPNRDLFFDTLYALSPGNHVVCHYIQCFAWNDAALTLANDVLPGCSLQISKGRDGSAAVRMTLTDESGTMLREVSSSGPALSLGILRCLAQIDFGVPNSG